MIYDLRDQGHVGKKVIEGHSLFMRLECNTYHQDMQLKIYIISLLHAHA